MLSSFISVIHSQKAEQSGVAVIPVQERRPSDTRLEFLGESDDVRRRLDVIDRLVDEMVDTVYRFQSVTTSSERRLAIASFEATVLDANTKLRDTKTRLDGLQQANLEFQRKFGDTKSTEFSFRVAALAGHTKRLRALFTRIASAQTMFEAEMNRRVGIQGAVTPEQTGDLSRTALSSIASASVAAKALSEVSHEEQRMRTDDMKRLEKSLREIREAFLQIAALVDAQGEMLDCIEFSVVNAKNYSHQANVQLIKARKKQRMRSLLWCCCGVTLTIVVVILILVILNATGAINLFNKAVEATKNRP
jgi:syntaxin 1B/2/3